LRERVHAVITAEFDTIPSEQHVRAISDDVFALVREALLSPSALQALALSIDAIRSEGEGANTMALARQAMEDALDSVFDARERAS
jgi:hypothetical protein